MNLPIQTPFIRPLCSSFMTLWYIGSTRNCYWLLFGPFRHIWLLCLSVSPWVRELKSNNGDTGIIDFFVYVSKGAWGVDRHSCPHICNNIVPCLNYWSVVGSQNLFTKAVVVFSLAILLFGGKKSLVKNSLRSMSFFSLDQAFALFYMIVIVSESKQGSSPWGDGVLQIMFCLIKLARH